MNPLGPRFDEALVYAADVHRDQLRKGTKTPYIAHLLAVCALVIEDGARAGAVDEDEAIAALLHDAAEDQGGEARLEDIRSRFGERVAEIVAACSDTFDDPKPPWRERKEAYIARLRVEDDVGVLRVSLADKLHNARQILEDYREVGDALWERFNRDADTPWYYETLAEVFRERMGGSPMTDQLRRVVAHLGDEIRS